MCAVYQVHIELGGCCKTVCEERMQPSQVTGPPQRIQHQTLKAGASQYPGSEVRFMHCFQISVPGKLFSLI
jgi:hypothetical protein